MEGPEAIDFLSRDANGARSPVHVIAVDGHSAAGKSTFARKLAGRLRAALVPGDDFYRVMDPALRAELTAEQGAVRYYDWERMLDDVIVPLRAGRAASYRPYDWDRNQLDTSIVTIEPASVVVVEGVFVSRPELAKVVDRTVVVVADRPSRVQRQLERNDASADWLDRWDAAESWFFEHVRPIESFDLVVEGGED